MSLSALPNELLFQIARYLLECPSCHCLHISQHLSALSRSNCLLRELLTEYLLNTASTSHILFWAIANSRHDTVSLALERGADPNWILHPNRQIRIIGHRPIRTPVELAVSMRVHSDDAESHALKLGMLALLLGRGGTCTIDSLIMPTRYGDLDLLTLCYKHLTTDEDTHPVYLPRTLLEVAARRGHVEAAKMAIRAGATVNSTGEHHSAHFYPVLWICWKASINVLQVLLDAGADPTWHARHGVSVVQHMRERSPDGPELEEKVALLVRYGAVDEPTRWDKERWLERRAEHPPETEYRGWRPGNRERPVDWPQAWTSAERAEGCGCPTC